MNLSLTWYYVLSYVKECLPVIFIIFFPSYASSLTPDDILKKADDEIAMVGDQYYEMTFNIVEKSGETRKMDIRVWQKGDKRLIRFTYPPQVKDMGILIEDKDTMYVYVPTLKKVRRIAAHSRNQSFMGSDFTYEEIGTMRYGYYYNISEMKEEDEHYVMKLIPKNIEEKEYGMLEVWIKKDRFWFTKIKYYNRDKKHIKTETRGKWEQYGDNWAATEIIMIDEASGHRSIGVMNKIDYGIKIDSNFFSVKTLLKGD